MPRRSNGADRILALAACLVSIGACVVVLYAPAQVQPPPVISFDVERKPDEVITSLVFSPDDRLLLARLSEIHYEVPGIRSRRLALIDRDASTPIAIIERPLIGAVCFSPAGDAFFFLSSEGIERYDISARRDTVFASPRSVCLDPTSFAIGISRDGRIVEVRDPFRDGRQYAWRDATGRYVTFDSSGAAWSYDTEWSYCKVSRSGNLFVCYGRGPTPRVYDLKNDAGVGYAAREDIVGPDCATISPDDSKLVCVYHDGVLIVWDLTSANGQAAPESFRTNGFEGVIEIEISNDAEWLACGRDDGTIELRRFRLQ